MEDSRNWLRRLGEYLIRKSQQGETLGMMYKRHKREISSYQSQCPHTRQALWVPFWICTNCEKVIREATNKEIEAAAKLKEDELATIIREYDVAYHSG